MPQTDTAQTDTAQSDKAVGTRRLFSGKAGLTLALLIWSAGPGLAEAPLSAISWLSESVATPVAMPVPTGSGSATGPAEQPVVRDGALPADVSVSVIGGPSPDSIGLLPPQVTGLPRALWGLGTSARIMSDIGASRAAALPSLQRLLLTLLLAEADPPPDAGSDGRLLLARVDKLLSSGALEQAAALLEAAKDPSPELFRRSFDVALLTGTEDQGCARMQASPALAPTLPARIFCLAREGDWNAAALTLRTAQALDQVSPEEDALLTLFLDPVEADGQAFLPPPERMTPLDWRLYEAIGETFPTTGLPLAFAHAELRDTAGWKAQLEAGERLARAGAIAPNRLLGIYTERDPAASGGVWDRVAAFQDLDAALMRGDAAGVARTLPPAWDRMAEAELEVPFADMVAARVAMVPLDGAAGAVAFRLGLLSSLFREAATARAASDGTEAFLIGLALGRLDGVTAPDSLGRAIAPAFLRADVPPEVILLLEEGRTGEVLLRAIERIAVGVETDLAGVTEGLTILRHLGLEDAARRTALELMLLERRG